MSALKYDPEFAAAATDFLKADRPDLTTVQQIRDLNIFFLAEINKGIPAVEDVEQQVLHISSYDGAQVKMIRFTPKAAAETQKPLPAVLYLHGGAMVSGSSEVYAPLLSYLAHRTGFSVFGLDWRVAPEHPAPAGLEDSYAALSWLSQNSKDLHIDAAKLVVMGDSAGGLLSASTALVARDRKLDPPLAKQLLIYPTLDDRIEFQESDPRRNFVTWLPSANKIIWKAYLDDEKAGTEHANPPPNTVPQRVADLTGLASTYIEVGTVDFFMDEAMKYTERLAKAGVEIEMHLLPGLPHGWELAGEISWFRKAMQLRVDAIRAVQ